VKNKVFLFAVFVFLAAAAAAATGATVIKGKKAGQGLDRDQFLTNFQAMSSVKNNILICRRRHRHLSPHHAAYPLKSFFLFDFVLSLIVAEFF
jgi:hypothetical protein